MLYFLLDFSLMNPIINTNSARKIANGIPKAHTIEKPNNAPPIESEICEQLTMPAPPLHPNSSISDAKTTRVITGNSNIRRLTL